MASITLCLKKPAPDWRVWLLLAVMLCLGAANTRAQPTGPETPTLSLERFDDGLWLSTQLRFELAAGVEDALIKGIPIYFVTQADLLRERWYWTNRKISSAQRRVRLSYQPLTRRWRINSVAIDAGEPAQGLALNQNFDSLQDALATVRRVSRWKIADISDLEPGSKHVVEFRFMLDVTQLPRPLQIGTLGQSDWLVSLAAVQSLGLEQAR